MAKLMNESLAEITERVTSRANTGPQGVLSDRANATQNGDAQDSLLQHMHEKAFRDSTKEALGKHEDAINKLDAKVAKKDSEATAAPSGDFSPGGVYGGDCYIPTKEPIRLLPWDVFATDTDKIGVYYLDSTDAALPLVKFAGVRLFYDSTAWNSTFPAGGEVTVSGSGFTVIGFDVDLSMEATDAGLLTWMSAVTSWADPSPIATIERVELAKVYHTEADGVTTITSIEQLMRGTHYMPRNA